MDKRCCLRCKYIYWVSQSKPSRMCPLWYLLNSWNRQSETSNIANSHIGIEHLGVVFKTWRDQVGVDGSNREGLHIFRSNFFTWGESQGIPDRELHAVLSHTRKGLTGVYGLYSYQKEKEEVLKRWARHLDKLAQPAVPPKVKKEGKYRNVMESPEAFEQTLKQSRKFWAEVAKKSD